MSESTRDTTAPSGPQHKSYDGFTSDERAAMKERAQELKADRWPWSRGNKADAGDAVRKKIAKMPESDRVIAERIHALVTATAPGLTPKLWYGMPAYARNGEIVCFFQGAAKFKSRYASFGFNDAAKLDAGTMWPTAYALTGLTEADEERVVALLRQAVS